MPLHLASLGSSFASGPGIPPLSNPAAGRSSVNYASLLAQHIQASHFTDLTVAGATLLNITTDPQLVQDTTTTTTFPPQLSLLPPDADIILILGGGNDVGYIGQFFVDAARSLPWVRDQLGYPEGSQPSDVPDLDLDPEVLSVDGLAKRYTHVLDAVHTKAPNAKVFVVEYLAMLGPETKPSPANPEVPFTAEQIAKHREKAKLVADATVLAATAAAERGGGRGGEGWCTLIKVTDESSKHHALGSNEPWVSGISRELLEAAGAFHPNKDGMIGVEQIVYRKLVEMGLVTED